MPRQLTQKQLARLVSGGRAPSKTHKYRAKPVTIDGTRFASRAEGRYYQQLKIMHKGGLIKDFIIQPVYTLHAGIKYIGDFDIIHNNGDIETVDVKGVETGVFRIKRRLFRQDYGRDITIIKVNKNHEGVFTFDKKEREDMEPQQVDEMQAVKTKASMGVDLQQLIGRYIRLVQRGKSSGMVGKCLKCGNDTLYVFNPRTHKTPAYYSCASCQANGMAVDFLTDFQSMPLEEAIAQCTREKRS